MHLLDHRPRDSQEAKIVVGVTCVLSAIGSLLIIYSYFCFRDLRTRAREVLAHISFMDLGVAVANVVGILVEFDSKWGQCYYNSTLTINGEKNVFAYNQSCADEVSRKYGIACVVQAAIAEFCTMGSVFWTMALAVYLYFLIVHGTRLARRVFFSLYLFCYAMPLFITAWLLARSRLGYARMESSGWCSVVTMDPKGRDSLFYSFFSYDLWMLLTFIVSAVLVFYVHHYVKRETKKSSLFFPSERVSLALQRVDYKFMMIPIAFILLRVWTEAINLSHSYFKHYMPHNTSSVVLFVLGGIGDSGQGFVNAVLFVVFTKPVRKMYRDCCCGLVRCRLRECCATVTCACGCLSVCGRGGWRGGGGGGGKNGGNRRESVNGKQGALQEATTDDEHTPLTTE